MIFTKTFYNFFLLFLISFTLSSCNNFECFKSAGEITNKTVSVSEFNSVQLNDLFKLTVIQDTASFIEINVEENFIENIIFEIIDSSLILSNSNKCRFLRNTGNLPEITLHTPFLDSILVFEASKIYIPDTFYTERFLLRFTAETGFADICLNTTHLAVSIWGESSSGEFFVKGKSEYFQSLTDGATFLYAETMQTDYASVKTLSAGNVYINPQKTISAYIYRSGNVYYEGNAAVKNLEEFSTGRLIKKN